MRLPQETQHKCQFTLDREPRTDQRRILCKSQTSQFMRVPHRPWVGEELLTYRSTMDDSKVAASPERPPQHRIPWRQLRGLVKEAVPGTSISSLSTPLPFPLLFSPPLPSPPLPSPLLPSSPSHCLALGRELVNLLSFSSLNVFYLVSLMSLLPPFRKGYFNPEEVTTQHSVIEARLSLLCARTESGHTSVQERLNACMHECPVQQ